MGNRVMIKIGLCGFFILASSISLACHKGGPMGFATRDPGMFSLDVTASTTFAFASTSGTSECKNWDFFKGFGKDPSKLRGAALQPLLEQWQQLAEEAAQGRGEHLDVLAQLMGCPTQRQPQFSALLHDHYSVLFAALYSNPHHERSEQFMRRLTYLLQNNASLDCSLPAQSG